MEETVDLSLVVEGETSGFLVAHLHLHVDPLVPQHLIDHVGQVPDLSHRLLYLDCRKVAVEHGSEGPPMQGKASTEEH